MLKTIQTFLLSRAMIRFYRVTGFGILSVILVELLSLVPQLALSGPFVVVITLTLTAILTAVDKNYRDLKSK